MANAKVQSHTRTRSSWRVSERRSAVAVLRAGTLPALLVLVMCVCLSTGADARRWRWWHYYSSYERSARSGEDDRAFDRVAFRFDVNQMRGSENPAKETRSTVLSRFYLGSAATLTMADY